jgi:hypothetical protein
MRRADWSVILVWLTSRKHELVQANHTYNDAHYKIDVIEDNIWFQQLIEIIHMWTTVLH